MGPVSCGIPESQSSDLYTVEVGGDLCRFLYCYVVGRILFTIFKHVLKCAAVLGRASVSEQFERHITFLRERLNGSMSTSLAAIYGRNVSFAVSLPKIGNDSVERLVFPGPH
jgi:hypothetical protein